ncbi:hypothetical protein SMD44_08333 [Streptomyces alboflavus]|uniref:Uncharacterized protein n=1 Tax=Streptomyces alboflavus TaxID=67267 RepID=A0A1Z1WQZ7_9ACTN|nr:hypothetical protein SMD44_08333 [Streptomyces alboflavus]
MVRSSGCPARARCGATAAQVSGGRPMAWKFMALVRFHCSIQSLMCSSWKGSRRSATVPGG